MLNMPQIFPGDLVATETKYAGRALPKGIVAGRLCVHV